MESDINKNLDFRRSLLVDFGECTHTHTCKKLPKRILWNFGSVWWSSTHASTVFWVDDCVMRR